jgi:hypothetical protein
MLLDGVPAVRDGRMCPTDTPGHGLTLRPAAEEYRVR